MSGNSTLTNAGWVADRTAIIQAQPTVVGRYPFNGTLVPEVGPFPTFYRDSGSGLVYVKDNLGVMWQTIAGECAFHGGRRVRNLARFSENLTFNGTNGWIVVNGATVAAVNDSTILHPSGAGPVFLLTRAATTANSVLRSQTAYVLRAMPHVFSCRIYANTATTAELRLYISGGATLVTRVVNITSGWNRFAISGTPDGTSQYVYSIAVGDASATPWGSGNSVSAYVCDVLLEECLDGTAAPSEYVPRDSWPRNRYWYGAGVDGVQWFGTAKANTVNGSTGLVTEATGADLECFVWTFPTCQQFYTNNDTLSGATATGGTLTAGAAASPDGLTGAEQLAEDTSTGVHYWSQTLTGSNTYDNKWVNLNVFARYDGANARPWVYLQLVDLAGATVSAFFNVQTGVVGTVGRGTGSMEPVGNGWYRCVWSVSIGNGASDAIMRVGVATADNTTSHTGVTGRRNWFWLPNATFPISAAGADRPIAVPAIQTGASAANVPGQFIGVDVEGLLGLTDFAVASTMAAYYVPAQEDKRAYGVVTYIRTTAPVEVMGAFGTYDYHRTGLTIRPNNAPGSPHKSKWAFDFYAGDVNQDFMWQANTRVRAGQVMIPRNTQPDNQNARKMYTAQNEGTTGGTEPTWNTSGFPTAPQTDGTVVWRCEYDNGITGNWEGYLGAHLVPANGFMKPARYSWFISFDDYGCFEDRVEYEKQTIPQFGQGMRTVLKYRPKTLCVGTFGTNKGFPSGASDPTMSTAEYFGTLTAMHRNLVIVAGNVNAQRCAAL